MTSRLTSAALATALAGFGVVVWAGCGPGDETRNYCDSNGCYSCDAYGCSDVTPPSASATPTTTTTPPVATTTPPATTPPDTCKFSSECGDGKVCANGQCLAGCDTSTPCATGFTCTKGACQPDSPTTGKTCSLDTDCPAGDYCNAGTCALDTRPKPNCTTDAQCGGTTGTPKVCLGGFCKYTCTTDLYCRQIDNRIGYCAKDHVCRNQTEANASCTQSSDCSGGLSCIDNTCK